VLTIFGTNYGWRANAVVDSLQQLIVKKWICPNSVEINLNSSFNAGHHWLTSSISRISADDVIWDFFSAHPKDLKYFKAKWFFLKFLEHICLRFVSSNKTKKP